MSRKAWLKWDGPAIKSKKPKSKKAIYFIGGIWPLFFNLFSG